MFTITTRRATVAVAGLAAAGGLLFGATTAFASDPPPAGGPAVSQGTTPTHPAGECLDLAQGDGGSVEIAKLPCTGGEGTGGPAKPASRLPAAKQITK